MSALQTEKRTGRGRTPGAAVAADGRAGIAGAPPSPRAVELLGRADGLLTRAVCADGPGRSAERLELAYVAAVRGAASVLAVRPAPRPRRIGGSAWALLAAAVPEAGGWAEYFAGWSEAHQAAVAGISGRVDAAAVAELVDRVRAFLDEVEALIGRVPVGAEGAAVGTRPSLARAG